jgi:hypothetical protein
MGYSKMSFASWVHSGTQTVNAGTEASLSVDGLGTGTAKNGLDALWDASTSRIKPTHLGQVMTVRIRLKCGTPNVLGLMVNPRLMLGVNIAPTPAGVEPLIIADDRMMAISTDNHYFTAEHSVFVGASFLANGGRVLVRAAAANLIISEASVTLFLIQ